MATVFPWIRPNRNKQAIHATHLYSADRHSSRPPPEFNDCGNDSAAGDDDHWHGFQRSTEVEICNQCTIPIGEAEQKDSSKKPDDGFQGPLIEFDFDNQFRMPIGKAELQEHLKKPDDWIQRQQSEINSHSTMFNREAEMQGHVKMPNDGFQRPQPEINSQSTKLDSESEQQNNRKKPDDGFQRPQKEINSQPIILKSEVYDVETQTKLVSPEKDGGTELQE